MKDNNKAWYSKGFKQGYIKGQKPMINFADGSATIRNDNFAFIAGRLSKDKEIKDAIAQIIAERDFAYADFEQYKVDVLGVDPEYVEDELPYDDYRYGIERCIEIIRKHINGGEEEWKA